MAKIYAVKKGFKTGIFESWPDCQAAVSGFSGAVYKSFNESERAAAEAFLDDGPKIIYSEKDTATAYIDGSYNIDTQEYSCGVILSYRGKDIEYNNKGNNEELKSMRNVAGELMGAVYSIKKAISLGAKKIDIHYDYEGIENWANGYWKANKKGTEEYKRFIDKAKKSICIEFHKVKAHSGNMLNERADELAKNAFAPKEIKINKHNMDAFNDILDKYPSLYNEIISFIRETNPSSEFDLIDDFLENNPKYECEDSSKIIDMISFAYQQENKEF